MKLFYILLGEYPCGNTRYLRGMKVCYYFSAAWPMDCYFYDSHDVVHCYDKELVLNEDQ